MAGLHTHSHGRSGAHAHADTSRLTQSAATASVAVAAMLIAIKTWAWLTTGSVAILSSLADSGLDLAASLFTFFAVRYAAAPPDREHRFGHGKAEAMAGIFQAGLVAVSAAFITIEAASHILNPAPLARAEEAVWVMIASLILTGGLVAYQTRALRQTGSIATKGDRAHYLADFASNLAVLAGVGAAALFDWGWADAAAALFVAAWLAFGAYDIAREAANQLLDRELPEADRERIRALAAADPAIAGVHDLRSRSSGPFMHVQMHLDLDPRLTLREVHDIVVRAEARILEAFPQADVIIHPDPMDEASPHGHALFGEGRAAADTSVAP